MTDTLAQTTDTVMGGRVILRQPADGYRVAIDPILLAAACPAQAGETIADLGCGIGTVLMLLAWRFPDARCAGDPDDRADVSAAVTDGSGGRRQRPGTAAVIRR